MVKFCHYFYDTEILVPLKGGKFGWSGLNKALKSRNPTFQKMACPLFEVATVQSVIFGSICEFRKT